MLRFNPAALLTVGDALAFVRMLTEPTSEAAEALAAKLALRTCRRQHVSRSQSPPTGHARVQGAPDPDAPTLPQQLAWGSLVTARVPQKYYIHNQTGLTLYYSSSIPEEGASVPVYMLRDRESETLRCTPSPHVVKWLRADNNVALEKTNNLICLQFEGNWLPIKVWFAGRNSYQPFATQNVCVKEVGKFRHRLISPADQVVTYVIVDVILVGRTKIITLHSGLWLTNRTQHTVGFRMHLPISGLVPPQLRRGSAQSTLATDRPIGPLLPGQGMGAWCAAIVHQPPGVYLPVSWVLGGLLFVQPEGYYEAANDAVHLVGADGRVQRSQSFITCQPLPRDGEEPRPLHCTLRVSPFEVVSEFQSFKHVEVFPSNEMQEATTALEHQVWLSVHVHPFSKRNRRRWNRRWC